MDRFDEMRGKSGSGGGNTGGFPIIIPPEAGNLTGIIISKKPLKVDYSEGDSLDMTGLEVTATYDNGVVGIVTGACEIVVDDPLTSYTKEVVVRYESFEASYQINVYTEALEIPSSALYLFHFNDNVKNALDSNEKVISSSPSFSTGKFGKACNSVSSLSSTFNKLASIETIITKGGYDFTFSFWIKFSSEYSAYDHQFGWGDDGYYDVYGLWLDLRTSTKLRLSVSSSKYIDYVPETSLLNTWLHVAFTIDKDVNATLFINGKKIGTQNFRMSGIGITQSKQKTIFWRMPIDELLITNDILYTSDFEPPSNEYGGEKVLQKIYIEEPPKTIYESGEYFSLEDGKIVAVFSDGTLMNVTSDCDIEGNTPLVTSDKFKTVTYTYGGVTKKVYINVGVYTVEQDLDLTETKLLMPFDGSSQDVAMNFPMTIYGNDTYSSLEQGKFGQARYFNGSTDYISMPYTQDVNIDTGDFTIALWAKATGTSAGQAFISICQVLSSANLGFRIGEANGNFYAYFSKDSNGTNLTVVNTYAIDVTKWAHYAVVRKGNVISAYVDGKLAGSVNYDGAVYNCEHITIGGRRSRSGGYEYSFTGYIDDLIITKSALWDGEFTPPEKPLSNM